MLLNPDTTTSNSSATMSVATACSNCGLEERRLLHQVRHRGVFRRLCTSCVLRLHPQSFCPTCFQVYPPPPSNDAVVTCFKCYSSSHSRCVVSGPTSPPNPYTCPLCLHPNTPVFKLKSTKEANSNANGNARFEDFRTMDRDSAKKLLAAAKIASVSMNKAAVAAKAEAERRAKEAAYARKRAKEALEHVAHLVMKEKLRKREVALSLPRPAVGTNGGYSAPAVKIDRESNASTSTNNRNGTLFNALEKPNIAGNVDKDNSSQVLAALNAVELRETVKLVDGGERKNDSNGDHASLSNMETVAQTLNTQEERIEDADNEMGNGGEQPSDRGSL